MEHLSHSASPAARSTLRLLAGLALAVLLVLTLGRPGVAMLATLHVNGGTPGTAGDASAATYSFAADDATLALTRGDGSAIGVEDVPAVYGTADGMTVRAGGVDVASAGYTGAGGPKRAVGRDLSDGTGWLESAAHPGEVAIDPVNGRFAFYPGGAPALAGVDDVVGSTQQTIGVALYGHYAYVSDRTRMIDVFDLSDPINPRWVKNVAYASGNGEALTIVGDRLYLTTKSGGLVIYSLADPANPVALGNQLPPADAKLCKGVFVQGNYAYVADEKGGVLIIDVSNPAHPIQVAALARYSESVWVVGRYVYVAGGIEGVRIFDVPNPARPIGGHIGAYATGGNSFGIQVQGNYAYVADGPGGLKILDISNPYTPVLVSQHRVGPTPSQDSPAYGVTVSGSLCYVTGFTAGCLNIFDVSDPAHPTLLKALALSAPAFSAAPSGPFVYVGNYGTGLAVVTPGFPEAPTAPVTVDYSYLDPNATPTVTSTPTATATPTSTPTVTPTWDPSARAGLVGKVSYQGRGAEGEARWATPLTVTLQVSGSLAPPVTLATRTDARGTFTVTELVPGDYVLRVRDTHSLFNRRPASLGLGLNPVDLGLLREGDANADNAVNLVDYSILAAAYRKSTGQAGFDARADFNEDGVVNLPDFSLLSSNYRKSGDAIVTAGASATAARTATLSLLPAANHIQPGENIVLDLVLDTGSGQADALAARVHFDPRYLTFMEVQLDPGLNVLTSGIDPAAGIYEVEMGVFGDEPFAGQRHVARLVLQGQAVTPGAGTPVQLVSAGSAVYYVGDPVLAGTHDAQVYIGTPLRYLWLPRVISK